MSGSESPQAGMIYPENILTFLPQMLTMKILTAEDGYRDGFTLGPNSYGNSYVMVAFQKWVVCFAQANT